MIAVVYCTQSAVTNADHEHERTPTIDSNAPLIRRTRGFFSSLGRIFRPVMSVGKRVARHAGRAAKGLSHVVRAVDTGARVYEAFNPKPDPNTEMREIFEQLREIILQILEGMSLNGYRTRRSSDWCSSSRVGLIGTNLELAKQLVSHPTVQNSELKDYLHVEEGGLICDANFCLKNGDGLFGFGLCSKEHCHCANGIPYFKECGEGTVYDPVTQICNWCKDVSICAFWSNRNQLWSMKHDGTIARQDPNKCVDNKDWSVDNGGLIQQWDCAITANQQWKIEPAAGSTDRAFIMNIHSRKCMQIKGISYDNGAQIEQWECSFNSPHANQLWKQIDGHLMNMNSGKCLDATEGSHQNGVILQQWDCS